MNTDGLRFFKRCFAAKTTRKNILSLSVLICVHLWLIFLSSCATKPTDMRTLVPAETLVYLETNDLAAALQPIVDAKPFMEVAKSKPDFSALKGVQLAVAVTGFETSEEKLTDEHSLGRVQPRFVAVAETHAWQFQTVRFAEQKLGAFVAEIYGSEPTLEKSEKGGGHYLVWTAKDGRKAFAVVSRSLIYFGNDESAIEKCLAVKRGEADSILTTGKIPVADPTTLAQGYVSTDGIAQIANLVGLKFASEAGDDSEVQSAIAGILPQLIRNSITEISWTSTKTEKGIEDKYTIGMPGGVASVFFETMRPSGDLSSQQGSNEQTLAQVPLGIDSATRYNFKNPDLAWRGALLSITGPFEGANGKIVAALGETFFEHYGIHDVEMFLRSIGNGSDKSKNIFTAKLEGETEGTFVLAMSGDTGLTKKSFVAEMKPDWQGEDGFYGMKTSDGDLSASFAEGLVIIGPSDQFGILTHAYNGKPNTFIGELLGSSSPIVTVGRDSVTPRLLGEMLTREGYGETKVNSTYLTETRFTKTGIDRRTTSDFGLIGSIIAELAQD